MQEVLHSYGHHFARARLKAAERLNRPELLTVVGAARYLGIGKSTLYHYEDGTKRPSLEQLEEIAKAYGLMVGDMLPSSALRSEEVAPIIAPLMAVPESARSAFIRQMAAFAETLAGAVDDARVQSVTKEANVHVYTASHKSQREESARESEALGRVMAGEAPTGGKRAGQSSEPRRDERRKRAEK